MKKLLISVGLLSLIALLLAIGVAAAPTGAADHLDAPFVSTDGQIDINDIYAFQSPSNPDNTVLIMTVNPLAGVQSPTTFRTDQPYQFQIDNNGDAKDDVTIKARFFNTPDAGVQRVRITKGNDSLLFEGLTNQNIPMKPWQPGTGLARFGVFDDPFFFDLVAFRDNLNFCPGGTGTDFFAGLNVSAIVIDLPSAALGATPQNPAIGVWGRIKIGDTQVERMGRPAINTVFIPSNMKDAFNYGDPRNDQRDFRDEVVATLLALGNDDATANALADVLLPDILTFDTSSSSGFLNGRQLANDVIDAELGLISGGAITTDCVDANDSPFLTDFPYLAAPH